MTHHQELLIPSAFGRDMAADLTYTPGSKHLVVYAHGINGFKDWGGMNLIAHAFAQEGFAFLKFNFSHNGTTAESPSNFEDLEAYAEDNYSIRQSDLKAVFNYVNSGSLPVDFKQIFLIGHSRGGIDALLFTAHYKELDGLITWASPDAADTPWSTWSKAKMKTWEEDGVAYLENKRTGQNMPLGFQLYLDVVNNAERYSVLRVASEMSIPWLIIHGTNDEAVSIEKAYNLKRSNHKAQMLEIEDAGHTFNRKHPWDDASLPEASQALVRASVDFLKNVSAS